MLIYLHRGTDRATAEREDTAARLEAQGWTRCTPAVHRALWRMADAQDKARIAREDARVSAPIQGTVYVVKGRVMP
jgi:multidrug efflux pump subunit AcrA (membrane-fusion protein)